MLAALGLADQVITLGVGRLRVDELILTRRTFAGRTDDLPLVQRQRHVCGGQHREADPGRIGEAELEVAVAEALR